MFCFSEEIWCNANQTIRRSWTDDTALSSSKVLAGKGSRLIIICHAGFIIDHQLVCRRFSHTTRKCTDKNLLNGLPPILCRLPEPSIIIIENAP